MAGMKKIQEMALGKRQYQEWRLRDLTEAQTSSAKEHMVEGVELFQKAFTLLESGDREGASAVMKKIAELARKVNEIVQG